MAIGLKDLSPQRAKVEVEKAPKVESEDWSRATMIARPWTTSNLTPKKPRAKKSTETLNSHMSDEWADDHTSALQAFDMETSSPLTQLNDLKIELRGQAVELERKIKRAAKGPFQLMTSLLGQALSQSLAQRARRRNQ